MLLTILILMLFLSLPSFVLSILTLKDRYEMRKTLGKIKVALNEKRAEFEKAIEEQLERN